MLNLDLFDESFDINRTETYELSIQLTLNGFSFAVKDSVRNSFITLFARAFEPELELNADWSNAVKQIVSSHQMLTKHFKRVLFSFQNPFFTVAPREYFEPEHAKKILELVCSIPEMDEIRYSNSDENIVSIFSIPSLLATDWLKIQPKTKFIGTGEHLMALGSSISRSYSSIALVSCTKPFPYVAYYKMGRLIHCSSIFAQTLDDTAYHTINICQKLNLPITETSVYIMGQHEEIGQLSNILSKYFKSASPSQPIDLHHYTYQLLRYKTQFASLFNLSLCE